MQSAASSIPSAFSLIQFHARVHPHACAVATLDTEISYRTFALHIDRMSRRIQALRIAAGTCVGVMGKDLYTKWLVTLALERLGLLSAHVSNAKELRLIGPGAIVSDESVDEAGGTPVYVIEPDWMQSASDSLPACTDTRHPPDAPCRIVLSSGTTGTPKRILLTFGGVQTRLRASAIYGNNTETRMLLMMGLATAGGFTSPLLVWAGGGAMLFPVLKPRQPVWFLLRMNPTRIFLSPAQLEGLVDSLPADYVPTRHMTVWTAGSMLTRQLSRKTRLRLSQHLYVVYGSTEAGTVTFAHASTAEARPGFVGFLMPWATIEIVGDDGQPLPQGSIGNVRVRSEELVGSYLDADTTDSPIRDGWFYPGDSGMLTANGGLVILGRTRELINAGGEKLAPEAAEAALANVPGVREIAVFGIDTPKGVRACAAVVASEEFDEDALRSRFKEVHPRMPPLEVTRVDSIPRNEMGKVLRLQLAAAEEEARSRQAVSSR